MTDTLQEAKKLEEPGFAPEQAAAIIKNPWRALSCILRNLECSGLELEQAEAILDYFGRWTTKA